MTGEADARALDQALDSLVHDLRTPLNGIKTWAHVLENQGLADPVQKRAVAGIMAGVDQQSRLIDELAEFVHRLGESSRSNP